MFSHHYIIEDSSGTEYNISVGFQHQHFDKDLKDLLKDLPNLSPAFKKLFKSMTTCRLQIITDKNPEEVYFYVDYAYCKRGDNFSKLFGRRKSFNKVIKQFTEDIQHYMCDKNLVREIYRGMKDVLQLSNIDPGRTTKEFYSRPLVEHLANSSFNNPTQYRFKHHVVYVDFPEGWS